MKKYTKQDIDKIARSLTVCLLSQLKLSIGNHGRKPVSGSLMLYHHLLASDKRCNTKFTENCNMLPH